MNFKCAIIEKNQNQFSRANPSGLDSYLFMLGRVENSLKTYPSPAGTRDRND